MVCINSVSHTTGIHLPDQKIALRNPVQGHNQGGGGFYGLRVRQEVVQHIVFIDIYTKPTIPLVEPTEAGKAGNGSVWSPWNNVAWQILLQ